MRGLGALVDTWWGGSEAAGGVGGRDGTKQHAGGGGGVHAFSGTPTHHGSKATRVLSRAEDIGHATGQLASPFLNGSFPEKPRLVTQS